MSFDLAKLRQDIPQLATQVRGKPLSYLDNGATTLKPQIVIDRVARYYREENSNVHRGAHWLAETGTGFYEAARKTVAEFIGGETSEIVFTRGTTESLNLAAQVLSQSGEIGFGVGDEVLLTELEHHSNIVPWQIACERVGAKIKVVPITDDGEID
ncbi:MAG: aminotransferase class V-fold PLP-dependent enzyme, partial [Bdellovibrionales bacterium]|nr:aminotransferase class V-fold PLP-dependent enzyme [Bdellovibrionales bacterium]